MATTCCQTYRHVKRNITLSLSIYIYTIPALIITVGKFIPNHLFNHYSYRFQFLWIYFFYSYRFSSFGLFFLQLQVSSFCAEAVLWTQHFQPNSTIFRNSGWKWLPTKFSHFQPKIQPNSAIFGPKHGFFWLEMAEFGWRIDSQNLWQSSL